MGGKGLLGTQQVSFPCSTGLAHPGRFLRHAPLERARRRPSSASTSPRIRWVLSIGQVGRRVALPTKTKDTTTGPGKGVAMATMFPPNPPVDYPSRNEIEVFRLLREDPATRDWLVLHSLFLAEHERRAAGEIDFVVIIPCKGVVCLEVKGAAQRRDGLWYYGSDGPGEPRSPFRQASDGMHTLRRYLLETHPDLRGVVFTSGVVFPFATFNEASIEWHDWQVVDATKLRRHRLSELVIGVAEAERSHLAHLPRPPFVDPSAPKPAQCQTIKDTLRGDFEVPVDERARARALDEELARYTEEQFLVLDGLERHPRVVVSGPAGTGKTLLAIESARRAHAEGRRVLLLCYNRLLGDWLDERTLALRPAVVAGNLHRYMLTASGMARLPEGAGDGFWDSELPEAAWTRVVEAADQAPDSGGLVFDELILDEAQDLLRAAYLDFLDASLRGGLSGGRWRMFGDFEHQAIYRSNALTLDEVVRQRQLQVVRFDLRVNCRNTPRTASWVQHIAGLHPPYARVRRPDDRITPEFIFYDDAARQPDLLAEILSRLLRSGFRQQDIVVLSHLANQPCAARLPREWQQRLRPYGPARGAHIGFTTIHAFKGLEAPAIVVSDVASILGTDAEALFYVAMTRAVQCLIILADARVQPQIAEILTAQMKHMVEEPTP